MSQFVCEALSRVMVITAAIAALLGNYLSAIFALASALAFLWAYVRLGERRR